MKRILLVSPNFYPEKTGIGVTASDCATFLKELGTEVAVLTAVPYYPEWKVRPEYRGRYVFQEVYNGIPVTRLWLYVPERVTTLSRILHELSFSLSLLFAIVTKRFDRVLCISPPLSAASLVALVALLKRRPFWLYIKDIQPDAAICLGMVSNPLVVGISRLLERFVYRRSEKLLVLSEGMKGNLLKKGVAEELIEVVPDSIDVEEMQLKPAAKDERIFRKRYRLEGRYLLLYSGNIGVKHNPEIIVELAARLRSHPDIFVAVVGEGALKQALESKIAELQLDNIGLYPLCERPLLADMYAAADVLLMPQRKAVLDIVVPSKLLSYLSSGTPVLASVHHESEAAQLLLRAEAGLVVPAEDVDAMADAVLRLAADPSEAARLSANGLRLMRSCYDHEVVKEVAYRRLFSS